MSIPQGQKKEVSNETKTVGGQIPVDLFWQFKTTYSGRHENAVTALIHAINLYIDAVPENDELGKEAD